jgi:hypothetical protein
MFNLDFLKGAKPKNALPVYDSCEQEHVTDIVNSINIVQRPVFGISSVTTGTCFFTVFISLLHGMFPSLQQWGFGDWDWLLIFSSLVNGLALIVSILGGFLVDFYLVRPFAGFTLKEIMALISGRFSFTALKLFGIVLGGALASGAIYFSYATSRAGSDAIAKVGVAPVTVDKTLRSQYETALGEQRVELAQFDKEFEDAKFEAEERKQQALAAAKNSTYFARLSEGEYFKSKYDKLVNNANDQYQKDIKAAKATVDSKKAEYQKLSGGLVESKKQELEKTTNQAESRVKSTANIIQNTGVGSLFLGLILLAIGARFKVQDEIEKLDKEYYRNNPKQSKKPTHERVYERNNEPETTRNSPQRFADDFDTGNVFRRQNL